MIRSIAVMLLGIVCCVTQIQDTWALTPERLAALGKEYYAWGRGYRRVDYRCLKDCTDRGYLHGYCMSRCSY